MRFTRPTLILLLAFAVYWSFESLMPRESGLLSIAREDFDLERAKAHVERMSTEPHAVGFPAHERVRDYIVTELRNMGLQVQLQTGYTAGDWANVSQATNILARIEGSREGGKDLMLLSHYDSSPHSSFGASDAGSGVATILEGVRAYLESGEIPENDIVILITDAEELGLNGADLFANQHPWTEGIGLILNFEARGSGGPSFALIETNRGNEKLIREFKDAGVRFPAANSLAYSIYKLLPNDTDLTVFREDRDIDGFNFAFVDDHFDYHTALDKAENLDGRTLAHQSSYLVPLLRHFSRADLSDLKSPNDLAYYNMPYYGLVSYPFDWIWPMYILAVLAFLSLLVYGTLRRKLHWKEIVKGTLPLLGALVINGLLGIFAWGILLSLYPAYEDMLHGFTYNGHEYIYAFAAFSMGTCFIMYNRFYPLKTANLLIAPIVLWLVITGLLNAYLPGASYFVIPVYALVAGLLISMDEEHPNYLYRFLLALPAVFILVPSIYLFPVALGLKLLSSTTLLLTLVFVATLPLWHSLRMMTRLSVLSLLLGALFFFKAHFQSSFNAQRPKPSSLLYVQDLDAGEAHWASYDRVLIPWNEQYFPEDQMVSDSVHATVLSSKYGTRFRQLSKAPAKSIPGPEIETYRDTVIADRRYLSIGIRPNRRVNRVDVYANDPEILEATVNGAELGEYYLKQRAEKKGSSRLLTHFVSNNAPTLLDLVLPAGHRPLEFEVFEASNDLLTHPRFSVPGRPENSIPMPFVLNDAIVLRTTFTIE